LCTAQFGNDNPSGEPLAKHAAAFAGLGTAEQAEILGNAQTTVLAQVSLERTAVGVAKPADANDPLGQAAVGQVRARLWVSP